MVMVKVNLTENLNLLNSNSKSDTIGGILGIK